MNDLQVKTIKLEPAKVEFNFDELSTILDEQLKKYEGLTFTEKEAKDCKATIAELNKGKKALNDYRLKTKKELTAPVTAFENECKDLDAQFNKVIGPLKEQHDAFEDDRKDKKRKEIQEFIDGLLEKEGLNDKYAAELVIEKEYLNKGKSMKSIKAELTTKSEHLGIKQDKDDADEQIIDSYIDVVIANSAVEVQKQPYISLLEFNSVDEVKEKIDQHVKKELEKPEPVTPSVPIKKAPTPVPTKKQEDTVIECYEVEGTDHDLDMLEEYMSSKGLTWKVIKG